MFAASLFAMYGFVEQQTVAVMLVVESAFTAILVSQHMVILYISAASGTVRSVHETKQLFF